MEKLANSGPPPVFVNEILLEPSHTHLPVVCDCFHAVMAKVLWHVKWPRRPKIFTNCQGKLFNSCFRESQDINRDAASGRESMKASRNHDSNNSYKIGPLARAANISKCCPCVSHVYPCRKSSHQAYSHWPFIAIGAFSFLVLRVQYPHQLSVSSALRWFFLSNRRCPILFNFAPCIDLGLL